MECECGNECSEIIEKVNRNLNKKKIIEFYSENPISVSGTKMWSIICAIFNFN